MVLKVSSGLGCGIVIDGTVFRGSRGSAGDIGHICVDPHHEARCVCGNRGCLEVVASAPAIIRRAEDLARTGESALLATMLAEHPRLTLDLLGEATSAGDPAAVSLLRETGSHIGFVLAGLVSFFNPHAIVVSSGIPGGEDILLSAIRQMVYQRALPASTRDLQIVDLAFTPDGGALGAAVLACEGFLGTAGRVAQARPIASAARSA